MGLFPPANLYNSATTRIGVICQFAKNNHSISAVLVDGYAKAENCATVSMAVAMSRTGVPEWTWISANVSVLAIWRSLRKSGLRLPNELRCAASSEDGVKSTW